VIRPDETSWKVDGDLWWLWVLATARTVVYATQHGRGFDEAAAVLVRDFEGPRGEQVTEARQAVLPGLAVGGPPRVVAARRGWPAGA
jgi:hypothetical protein